jgi:glucokinase
MTDYYIAVDLGGTNIRAARCTKDGQILARTSRRTLAAEGETVVIERIIATIGEVWPTDASVRAIGISAPGPLDPWRGIVIQAPNLPGWSNVPLRDIVAKALHTPTRLGNDANLAALAEYHFGAGKGYDDMIYFTLSTGIGGGAISGGRLLLGAKGLAAEFGHISVDLNGPRCNCGSIGCVEAIAAGPAIAKNAMARIAAGEHSAISNLVEGDLSRVSAETVGEAALAGDPLARSVVREAGRAIGQAVVNVLHTLNPGIVVCGGGLTKMGDLLMQPIREMVSERVMNPNYVVDIILAQLGDDVALLGALALAMEPDNGR